MKTTRAIHHYYFILFWTILGLVQAHFTELTSDEGYYWFYSTQLQWGYYDHPPMLALLSRMGVSLLENELGVRMFSVLLGAASLFLFFDLLPKSIRHQWWLYGLLLAVPLFNYLNIFIFPDTPLLAFELLFLWAYHRFLNNNDWSSALLMGVAVALMFYSKYHGVLVIGFILMANWRLFLNLKMYVAGLLAFLLFVPHLWWQYSNDFPTFAYHLDGRIQGISTRFVFEYLSQQLLFITPILIIVPWLYKVQNTFERSLKVIFIGTLLFFLGASFKTFVHFHWTSIALIPAIILVAHYYQNTPSRTARRLINIGIGLFGVLMLLLRVYWMVQILPAKNQNVDYYHDRDLWAADLHDAADGHPIIFEGNLREASLYQFYSHSQGIALYPGMDKKSQYELWNAEEALQGKRVMLVCGKPFAESQILETRMGKSEHYKMIDRLISYQDVRIKAIAPPTLANDTLHLDIQIINQREQSLPFEQHTPRIVAQFYGKGGRRRYSQVVDVATDRSLQDIPAQGTVQYAIQIPIHELTQTPKYFLLGFQYGYSGTGHICHNSRMMGELVNW